MSFEREKEKEEALMKVAACDISIDEADETLGFTFFSKERK